MKNGKIVSYGCNFYLLIFEPTKCSVIYSVNYVKCTGPEMPKMALFRSDLDTKGWLLVRG